MKKKHKYIRFVLALALIAIIVLCVYSFSFSIIQGDCSDIERIEVTMQGENSEYTKTEITNQSEIETIYDIVCDGAKGNIENVVLYPSHEYSKDSQITISIIYKSGKQNIYVGYELVYDLNPKFGSSERGFAYVNNPSVLAELKEYCNSYATNAQ